jgi:hypothetical protein
MESKNVNKQNKETPSRGRNVDYNFGRFESLNEILPVARPTARPASN